MLYSGKTSNVTWSSYLVTIKCSVSNLCGHFCEARGRSERLSLCGWITGTEEQKSSRVGTMRTFFSMVCVITKTWCSPVVRTLSWNCSYSLWGNFIGPHRLYHPQLSWLSTRNSVSFLGVKKKKEQIVLPGAFGLETKKPYSWACDIPGWKHHSRRELKAQTWACLQSLSQNSLWQQEEHLQSLCSPQYQHFQSLQRFSRGIIFAKGRYGSKHNFCPPVDGQIQDSSVLLLLLESQLGVSYVSSDPLRIIEQVQLPKKPPSASLVCSN